MLLAATQQADDSTHGVAPSKLVAFVAFELAERRGAGAGADSRSSNRQNLQGTQRVFPSAANGYYVMLKPLSPGKHEINFGGALPGMLQAVTYTVEVE